MFVYILAISDDQQVVGHGKMFFFDLVRSNLMTKLNVFKTNSLPVIPPICFR